MPEHLMTASQRAAVERYRATLEDPVMQRCAELLLMYDDGATTAAIAEAVDLSQSQVRRWRQAFREDGLSIFSATTVQDGTPAPQPEAPPSGEAATGETPPATAAPVAVAEKSTPEPVAAAAPPRPRKPGVKARDTLAVAARKVLRYHFEVMLENEPGVRLGEDIEAVHDMRVAIRRQRAAFEVFARAFDKKSTKPILRGLRDTGRALGDVRDLDVMLEKTHARTADAPDVAAGLAPLFEHWETTRVDARQQMLAYLDSEPYRSFVTRYDAWLDDKSAGVRKHGELEPVTVRELAPLLIYERYAAVLAYGRILDTASVPTLHQLRIEFKRFRYTIEFLREVLGKPARDVLDDIRQIQDHLGDLNDAEVAVHTLDDFIQRWERDQAQLPLAERQNPEPVVRYMGARHAERHQLLVTFGEAWAYFERPAFRKKLAEAIGGI